jgi:antitoxin component YwqK of YwqJK toxin-antitoxin module
MKFAFSLLFICAFSTSPGQIEPLDQRDSDGKKNGKWTLYYDVNWAVVSDTSKASSYCFTYFDHGTTIYTNATWGTPNGKLVDSSSAISRTGKIKLLDGKYTWLDAKGKVTSIHYFSKGELLWRKEFYANGMPRLYMDFVKKCEGQPHSWSLSTYDKKGKLLTVSPICRDKDGHWPIVR